MRTVTVPRGTQGWFLTPWHGFDVADFTHATACQVEEHNEFWFRTVGQVKGFGTASPDMTFTALRRGEHPPILIEKKVIEESN